MSLIDYTQTEPPAIDVLKWVPHREDPQKHIALLAVERTETKRCLVFPRRREDGPSGEKSTYYRKGGGYAISQWVLGFMQCHSIPVVFVKVQDEDTLLKFERSQYEQADEFVFDGDPQHCVPSENALDKWSGDDAAIHVPGGVPTIPPSKLTQ